MDRHYLTKAVRSLQRSLRAEQERSARNRQQYEERVKNLRKDREDVYRLYCRIQNLYEKECKHSKELFEMVVKYQARMTFYRATTFALMTGTSLAVIFNYLSQ